MAIYKCPLYLDDDNFDFDCHFEKEKPNIIYEDIAYPRFSAEFQIYKYQHFLFDFLLQLFYLRDDKKNLNKRIMLIVKCLFYIPKIRTTRGKEKHLSFSFLYYLLWEGYYEKGDFYFVHEKYFNLYKIDKEHIYYKQMPDIPKENAKNAEVFVRRYYRWLSKCFSVKSQITFDEAKTELVRLLDKFPI